MDLDVKKKRRRSLRISQDLEICAGNYGSVWKEPSPESRRMSELKEKRRRRSKMFNADELQQFRIAETPDKTTEVDCQSLLDFRNTSLSEVEEPRCPDSSIGQQESLRITPVVIEEEMISRQSGKVTNEDKKERTPLPEAHPNDYSTPIAPPVLSDSLPYSPSQPFVADISQSPTLSSLVSPNSPASDGEFFTPLSQIKSRVVRNSNKKIRTKLQPKQLSAGYSDVDLKSNEHINIGDPTSAKSHFMNVCKSLGEKLALLKNTSISADSAQNNVNDSNVSFDNGFEDDKIANIELKVSQKNVDSTPTISESLQENVECIEKTNVRDNKIFNTENAELEKLLVKERKGSMNSDDIIPVGTGDVDASVFPSPEVGFSDQIEENSPQVIHARDVKGENENNSNVLKKSVTKKQIPLSSSAGNTSKVKSAKRGRPKKLSQDNSTTIRTTMQSVPESVEKEMNYNNIESCASVQESKNVCMDLEADSQMKLKMTEISTCNEYETHLAEDDISTSQKVKRKRGRPRKSLSDDQCGALPVTCPSVFPTDDAVTMEDNNTECEDGQSQEEQIAEEKKSRRLRRRSFEIFRACREEPSETTTEDKTEQEETKDFGSVLKDLNGTTAPVKAPRKRKKSESEEDIAKIYTAKDYLPPPLKALETISESPSLAKQARKLKRLIDFGSLYHIPPIKQKKRQQKAAKRGWDQRKVRKNKIPDDVAQQKLQSIWDELDTDKD